jgi:hypothetical protein
VALASSSGMRPSTPRANLAAAATPLSGRIPALPSPHLAPALPQTTAAALAQSNAGFVAPTRAILSSSKLSSSMLAILMPCMPYGGRLGRSRLSMAAVGLLVGPVVRVVVLGGNGEGFRLRALSSVHPLAIKAERNCTSPPLAFLRGVPLTPPLSLATAAKARSHAGFLAPAHMLSSSSKLSSSTRAISTPCPSLAGALDAPACQWPSVARWSARLSRSLYLAAMAGGSAFSFERRMPSRDQGGRGISPLRLTPSCRKSLPRASSLVSQACSPRHQAWLLAGGPNVRSTQNCRRS